MPPKPPKKRPYAKPWLSYKDQLSLLTTRGLTIADPAAAQTFLSHVNYYRLSGFCLAFETHRHAFRPGVTFDDIKAAYEFDVRLRDLLNEALEVIEIDIRTCLTHFVGQRYGAFGHLDPNNFFDQFDHGEWIEHIHDEVDRSSELFVEHFRNTYTEYPDLPVWVLMEIVSFGTLTRMYRGMRRSDQRVISNRYRLQPQDFGTILLHLAYVRNLCAASLASLGSGMVREGEPTAWKVLGIASCTRQRSSLFDACTDLSPLVELPSDRHFPSGMARSPSHVAAEPAECTHRTDQDGHASRLADSSNVALTSTARMRPSATEASIAQNRNYRY